MDVHLRKPVRRALLARSKYVEYRDDLRRDFNGSCGYCDDSDLRADRISFHIDHFAPKKQFPDLENSYDNLVYACRFCNMRKSDHWVGDDPDVPNNGEEGFIDPCRPEYDEHLERNSEGQIIGKSSLGWYIIKRLSLNLMRHELLWKARRMHALRDEIDPIIDRLEANELPLEQKERYTELLKRFRDLTKKIDEYELSAIHG